MEHRTIDFTIWGRHPVEEALSSSRIRIHEIFLGPRFQGNSESIRTSAQKRGVPTRSLDRQQMEKRLGTEKSQSVGARITLPTFSHVRDCLQALKPARPPWCLLAVDTVQDPQNLGSLFRSAHFFGANALLLSRDRTAPISGTVAKASAGALFSIPLISVPNLARALEECADEGLQRIGLDSDAPGILRNLDLAATSVVLVVGSEGRGLRALTTKRCDHLVRLSHLGFRDSLNVGVAAAIALYEVSHWQDPKPGKN